MRVQVVRARVSPASRERYLAAWSEWSGTLFPMGIRTELLESEESPGEFVELTWFEPEDVPALGDDRIVRIQGELDAASDSREGALRLYRPVKIGDGPGGEGGGRAGGEAG